MTGGNFLVTRENGFLSVVRSVKRRASDGRERNGRLVFNIAGNTEGLEEGDILRADSLDFDLKRVEYTEDGKQRSKIIMLLYGWEKRRRLDMEMAGNYTMVFIEGFFIRDLSCYSDGTKKISECRSGVLGDLLKEEERGYSAMFCSLDGVPVRVLFPKEIVEDKELFFSCSLGKDYRISGNMEIEVGRGTGIKDYYIAVRTFSSVGKRTEEKNF